MLAFKLHFKISFQAENLYSGFLLFLRGVAKFKRKRPSPTERSVYIALSELTGVYDLVESLHEDRRSDREFKQSFCHYIVRIYRNV